MHRSFDSTHKNGDLSEPRRNQLTRRWEGPSNVTQLVPSLLLVRTCVCARRRMFADFLPGVQCRGILTTALLLATLFSHFGTQVPPSHKINKQVGQEANVISHNLATFPLSFLTCSLPTLSAAFILTHLSLINKVLYSTLLHLPPLRFHCARD
jgi:hypothetical protein